MKGVTPTKKGLTLETRELLTSVSERIDHALVRL